MCSSFRLETEYTLCTYYVTPLEDSVSAIRSWEFYLPHRSVPLQQLLISSRLRYDVLLRCRPLLGLWRDSSGSISTVRYKYFAKWTVHVGTAIAKTKIIFTTKSGRGPRVEIFDEGHLI